jgi:hypothetical protein
VRLTARGSDVVRIVVRMARRRSRFASASTPSFASDLQQQAQSTSRQPIPGEVFGLCVPVQQFEQII